ncbi:MAG: DUF445 family protein [Epulopiscium sp.]|nr:DUF445 family protein [Candidatus Epulonipiscium sp.]
MTLIQWLSPAVVGAFIGYITNWLAIKMLFRPYTEKRIGFLKVPFTPGLIPKEQGRIAHSVGQTIGEHLLTEELLIETLTGPPIQDQLRRIISQWISELQKKDIPIDTWLEQLVGEEFHALILRGEEEVIRWIMGELQNPKLQQQLATWAIDEVKKQIQKSEIEEVIRNIELSPSALIEVEEYLLMQGPTLAFYIQKIFHHPLVEDKLKQFLAEVTKNQLGKMAAFLINPDKIYQRFLTELEQYVLQEENQKELIAFIIQFIKEKSNMSLRDILEMIPSSLKQTGLEQGRQLFTHWEQNLYQGLIQWIMDLGTSDVVYKKLHTTLSHWRQLFMKRPVHDLFRKIQPEGIAIIQEKVVEIYIQLVREKGGMAVQFLDIPKLVEDQIQSFDTAYTEAVILSIAKKELQAITWLGALLGFVMGIVINFL